MKKTIWSVLADGLLLLCTLFGFVGCFLTLYPDIPYLSKCSIQLTALSILFAVLSLFLLSLPKYRIPAILLFLVGMAATAFYFQLYLLDGARLVLNAILKQVYPRLALDLHFYLLPIDWDMAVLLTLTMALALIALALGWSIVRARRWWLTVLITLLPILPALLCEDVPHPFALTLLAGSWAAMVLTSLCRSASAPHRGRLTLVFLPIVCILLGTLLTLSPQEAYERPNWSTQAQIKLYDFVDRYLPFLSDSDVGASISTSGADSSVDLREAGPRIYTGRTVLQIKTKYVGTLYIRGNSYAVYQDNQWKALDSKVYENFHDTLTIGEETYHPLFFPAMSHEKTQSFEIAVRNMGLPSNFLYQPYGISNWTHYVFSEVQDSGFRSPTDLRYHTYTCAVNLWDLSAVSPSFEVHPEMLSAMEKYESFVYDHYLDIDLSDRLTKRLDNLLSDDLDDILLSGTIYFSGKDNPNLSSEARYYLSCAEKVVAVLARDYRYDINSRAIPEDADFVEYFLLSSRKGYCVHFASAATIMLRYMGVPARYVSGFTFKTAATNTTTNVLDDASHAWVEIYLPGYGWYPIEVTPGYYGIWEEDPDDQPGLTETPEPEPSDESIPSHEPTPSTEPSDEPSLSPKPSIDPSNSPTPSVDPGGKVNTDLIQSLIRAVKWAAAAAGSLFILYLVQLILKRVRRKRLHSPDSNRAALYAYRYLTRLTRWGGRVPPEALELARKARFSSHSLTTDELTQMNAFFDEERRRIPEGLSSGRKLLFHYLWGIPK